ncbi:mucin-2-like isoform X3 [Neocloeon triangulifer]|uniref:mucin-2-like isoform X3 n=1 Tax=Neocloeon triangulifer TaxID=2078957 RepID=UPI00286EFB82|nr:mucin-2-like isoform X3 [Neocloeon triangulifer]
MRCVILVAVLVCVQSAIGQLYYWAHSPALEPHYAYGDVITSWDPGVQQTQRLPRLAISDDTEFAASSSDFVNKSPSTDSSSRRKARQRYNGVNQGLAKRAEAPQDAAADGLAAVESEKAAPPKRPRSRTAGRAESPTQQPAQQDAESTTAKNGRGRGGFRGKATFTTPDIPERNRGRSLRGPQNIESPAAVGSTEGTSVIKRRPVNVRRKPYGGDTQRKPFPSNSEADGEKSSTSEKPSTEKPIKRPFLPPEEVSLKEQHQKPPTDVRPVTYKPPLPPNKPSNSSKPAPKPTTFKPSFVPKDLLVSETTTAAAHPSPKFTHVKSVTIISTSPEQVSIKPHRTSVVRTTAKPLHKATTVVKAISPKGEHKKAIIVSIGTTPLPTLNSTTAQQIRTSPRLSIKNSVLDLSPPASSSKFGLSSTPYNPYSSIKVTSTPAASSKTPTTVSVTPPSTTTSTTTDRLFPAHVSSPSNDLQPPNEQKTTAARRRKPSGEANKNSTPRPRNSDEDISESDNYPDEFKQKIKSGGKKEKETPFIVTPSKTYPLKSSTTTTTKAPATTTTTTTAQPKTLPPVDKLIEEDNQLTTKVRRPSRPSATTPFPRRRSPTLAPRVPSEGKDDAAIKSRAELLKKGNRRPPLQSASLINEGIREAKEEIVSTAAPRVYSRPNRPVAAIAPEQQEDTPLTPLVQKFSSKYRGDLKGIVSNAPVYVPTVPPLTVSLLSETNSTKQRGAKIPVLPPRVLSTRQAPSTTTTTPLPTTTRTTTTEIPTTTNTPLPKTLPSKARSQEAVTEKSKGSTPIIKPPTTPKPPTTTTTLAPKIITTTQTPVITTTQKLTTQKQNDLIQTQKPQVATIITSSGLRSSTARTTLMDHTIPRLESIFDFSNDLRSQRALGLVTEKPISTEPPSSTQKSSPVLYTESYSKVTTSGIPATTTPIPSVVLATSSSQEEMTPPPRFAVRIPILPFGTQSSTPVSVSSTFPNHFSARREKTLFDETTSSSTSTTTSQKPQTTSTTTSAKPISTSTTTFTPPTTLSSSNTHSRSSTTVLYSQPYSRSTTTEYRVPETTTEDQKTSSTSPRTTSYASISRSSSTANIVPEEDDFAMTEARSIIHTTTPVVYSTLNSLKYNPTTHKVFSTTVKLTPHDNLNIEDNEVSQSSLSPPPVFVASTPREQSARGFQVTSPATAPVAEALTSTTKKEESLLEFGSNFDFPTETSTKGSTTERATFIYKVPRNKGTTPLSTDAPTSSTTESFRWKPLETTETTSEKVEVVTAETVGPTEDLLFDLINAQKSTTSSTTTTTTTTTTTSTTTTTTPRAPISTTEFEGLDLASLFKSTTKTNIRPTVSSIETSNSGRKVPNNVVPIINENNHVEQPTRRPSRTRQTTEPTTTTTTTSTSTTTTTEAPSTKKTKVWVVPKDAGESTSASNNEETSNKAAIPGFGGITANDLLLLELLSKRGGQTPEETKPANSKTADKPKIDFAGLNLAKLLAAGENGDATELDASLFPAPPSTTTRRPRVVPTNPPAPAYAAPAYEAPAQAVGSGAWNAVQGSGSTLFQLLRVIGGASIGPSNSAGQAPVAEPDEVYLEPATTASTRTRGRQQNKPTATNGRRPGYRTTTLSPYFAEELPDSFDAPQAPPQSALVTVAINVTKTVASLMARVLSGAARTFGAAVRGASTAIQEQWQQPSS